MRDSSGQWDRNRSPPFSRRRSKHLGWQRRQEVLKESEGAESSGLQVLVHSYWSENKVGMSWGKQSWWLPSGGSIWTWDARGVSGDWQWGVAVEAGAAALWKTRAPVAEGWRDWGLWKWVCESSNSVAAGVKPVLEIKPSRDEEAWTDWQVAVWRRHGS